MKIIERHQQQYKRELVQQLKDALEDGDYSAARGTNGRIWVNHFTTTTGYLQIDRWITQLEDSYTIRLLNFLEENK